MASLAFLRSPTGPFEPPCPTHPIPPPSHAPRLAWWVRGPPQQVGCGWGASPGIGGVAPPRWVCMWPASWAGVLQCTLHSLHRMRSARGAWSPWSFTAWMRRYAAVVKPMGGRIGMGDGGQPDGDPRDGAVLLGWGCLSQMALSSSHHILGSLGPTTLLGLVGRRLGPEPGRGAGGWCEWCPLLSLGMHRAHSFSMAGRSLQGNRTLIPSYFKG